MVPIFCSIFFNLLFFVLISPHSQPLPSWNSHFPWLLLHFLWFTSNLLSVVCLTIKWWILQSQGVPLLLFLLCIHVFSDFTRHHDFKYNWQADMSHISISSIDFKIHVHTSRCLLDISTWMFPWHLKPSRSAGRSWLPLLVPCSSVLPISANGTTLHQWLHPKTQESSFMSLFPLCLTSSPSPTPAFSTLNYILNWLTPLELHCYPLGLTNIFFT